MASVVAPSWKVTVPVGTPEPEEGFTIAGARQQLRLEAITVKNQAPLPFPAHSASDLRRIRHGLEEILTMLSPRA